MRKLTDHIVNGLNEALEITVTDEPGAGGANHSYIVSVDETKTKMPHGVTVHTCIGFQNGPIQEVGVNGLSQESLLTIVIDRLRCFQAGAYPCRENAIALTKCEEALMWLKKRTQDRLLRGVEGLSRK